MEFFLLVAIIAVVIVVISNYFSKNAIIKRKLKKALPKRISEVNDGEVAKIIGTVEIVGSPIIAPLSGRKCAYYHVIVKQKVSSGKSSRWKTLIDEEFSGELVLRDGNHVAYISKNDIKSSIVKDEKFSSGFLNDADDTLEKYLQAHGHKSENFFGFNKTLRYSEGVLEPGEKVAVLGTGKWVNAEQVNLPGNYNKVLHMKSTESEALYLSDAPETTI